MGTEAFGPSGRAVLRSVTKADSLLICFHARFWSQLHHKLTLRCKNTTRDIPVPHFIYICINHLMQLLTDGNKTEYL